MKLRQIAVTFILISVSAAHAAPIDGNCTKGLMAALADPANPGAAARFFDQPGMVSNIKSTERALTAMVTALAGISRIEALSAMPDGKTARVQISPLEVESPFIGTAFRATSGRDGPVTFFVAQRTGAACSISSVALHLPDSLPHFQERAGDITRAISAALSAAADKE